MNRFVCVLALITATLSTTSSVQAGVMLAPISATTSFGSEFPDYPIANTFNQSGLFASYTSGVTDFDSFVASTNHDRGLFSFNNWASPINDRFGSIDFVLSQPTTVDAFALWNMPGPGGIDGFRLFASNDSTFTTSELLGSFSADFAADDGNTSANVFSFDPITAQFFRLQIDSVQGSAVTTMIGEVAFSQVSTNAVPEPSTLSLLACSIICLCGARVVGRRRQQARIA